MIGSVNYIKNNPKNLFMFIVSIEDNYALLLNSIALTEYILDYGVNS